MPALVSGYEYDIFISYRQKDNRYDGWVTEFVQNLKKELDATLKDEVSIYFDENPHDGLSETHHVELSLEPKLKSLIFIPILSRTYCDPRSFAWINELLAFRDQAKGDSIGGEVRLHNGNVASRILPVRIHELDAGDKELFERETGGPLRAVDFVFRAAGVNRPLRAKDDDLKEIQHAQFYRDQINKVSIAVGELLAAMSRPIERPKQISKQKPPDVTGISTRRKRQPISVLAGLLLVTGIVGWFNYEKWFSNNEVKTILVLPFENLSPDSKDEYLSNGFYDEVINQLSCHKGLMVLGKQSAVQVGKAGMGAVEINRLLGVKYLLTGSVKKDGDRIQVSTKLENASTGAVVSAKKLERDLANYFELLREVSNLIVADIGLIATDGEIQMPLTTNLRAFELLRESRKYDWQSPDTTVQNKYFSLIQQSIQEDSMFQSAWFGLVVPQLFLYGNRGDSGMLRKALEAKARIESIDPQGIVALSTKVLYSYWVLRDYGLSIRLADEILEARPYYLWALYQKGLAMRRLGDAQGFINNHINLLQLDPLADALKFDIALELINRGQIVDASIFVEDLRAHRYYYYLQFNIMVLNGDTKSLDSLALAAASDIRLSSHEADLPRKTFNGLKNFYDRNYANALLPWPDMDAGDSAIVYRLMGDSVNSRICFDRKRVTSNNIATRSLNEQVASLALLDLGVAQAGLGDASWRKTFEKASRNLDALGMPYFRHRYTLACLLDGALDDAFNVLAKRSQEDIGYGLGVGGFIKPMSHLLKDHPLLDPLRQKPGFEDLWEGNHLKVKKLKVPRDLKAVLD